MKRFFITGSGTNAGKTFVTAAIASKIQQKNLKITCLKPIASGIDPASPDATSDPAILLAATGQELTSENIKSICPWQFKLPASPDIAATHAGAAPIRLEDVIAFCRSQEQHNADIMLVEGAGGVMTPISPAATMLDLAAGLGYPVIVVTGCYLGAISHTLSACTAIEGRGLEIAAIVISETAAGECNQAELAASIRNHVKYPVIEIPQMPSWRDVNDISALMEIIQG